MTDNVSRLFEGLPSWARQAIDERSSAVIAPSPDPLKDEMAWPLLVDAAIVSTFLPKSLAPDVVPANGRRVVESVVLSLAEQTKEARGIRWSLSRDVRQRIVERARQTGDLAPALIRTATHFGDEVSAAMRACLNGPVDPSTLSLPLLEATRIAASMLAGVEGLTLPPVDDLDARIERERLLAQFDRMVGADGKPHANYFVGRQDELLRLRAYVGIVKSASVREAFSRAAQKLVGTLTAWAPLAIIGIGGVGKTTLMAKFMLEHSRTPSLFPFAYIDFDRPSVSARNRSGIIAEMALQVAAQFPQLASNLRQLRSEVSELGRRLERSDEATFNTPLIPYLARFRGIVNEYLEKEEWPFQWARPFLLVFDTFEVVQYSGDDESGLSEFVQLLSEDGTWKRLRVVISGRKPIANFRPAPEELELQGLDFEAAVELLMHSAAGAGKPISSEDAGRLVGAIAAADPNSKVNFKPQRLRVIGNLFADAEYSTGKEVVSSIVKDLSGTVMGGGAVMRAFIDAILIRRTLGNVSDVRVRALADPGLVVRMIRADVIQHVMVPGTPKPGTLSSDNPDPATYEPWSVSADEARDIFAAFQSEITLVDQAEEGVLRHRADVREDMLPVIRFGRPRRFAALHRLAYEYFRGIADSNPRDEAAAAEAVYHGLWSGAPLPEVDKYWLTQASFQARINPNEFDRGSLADIYLRAKVGTGRQLDASEVAQLPPAIAIGWLQEAVDELLLDRQPEVTLGAVRQVAGNDFVALNDRPSVAATVARLLFRNGDWGDAVFLSRRQLKHRSSEGEPAISLFRTFASVVGRSALPLNEEVATVARLAKEIASPFARVEALAHVWLGSQTGPRPGAAGILSDLREAAHAVPRSIWTRELRCLRLGLLALPDLPLELLQIYLQSTERLPHDVRAVAMLHELFIAAYGSSDVRPKAMADIEWMLESERAPLERFVDVDRCWRADRATFLRAIAERRELWPTMRWLIAFQHFDWVTPLGNAISRLSAHDSSAAVILRKIDVPISRTWLLADGRVDGVALTQTAAENGVIRDVAKLLSGQQTRPDLTLYAADAFGIADALLRWHASIVTLLQTESRGQQVKKSRDERVGDWAKEHLVDNAWEMGPHNWERCLWDLGEPDGQPNELAYEEVNGRRRLKYQ
jgi:hypothetical protein